MVPYIYYWLLSISIDKNWFKLIIFKVLLRISSSDSLHRREKTQILISDFHNFSAHF